MIIAIESAVAVLRQRQRSLAALGAQRMTSALCYLILISLHGAAYARAMEEFSAIYAVQSTFVSWSPMIAATNGVCIGTADPFVRLEDQTFVSVVRKEVITSVMAIDPNRFHAMRRFKPPKAA